MKFFPLQFIFLIFFFSSCAENNSESKKDSVPSQTTVVDSATKKETTKIEPRKITENTLACFYIMNDKNKSPRDIKIQSQWIEPFLDSVSENAVEGSDNLFNKDAGPMGARLNPMGDILFVAFFKGKIDTTSLVFKVNDFDLKKDAVTIRKTNEEGITTCWFVLPRIRYNVMLHPPSEDEKKKICADKNIDEKSWVKNSCTSMTISASVKEEGKQITIEHYILATFVQ